MLLYFSHNLNSNLNSKNNSPVCLSPPVGLTRCTRFGTASEMEEALYACLIAKGEAFYSAFISYRVASEAPLARLLFDELNHRLSTNRELSWFNP